MWLGPGGGGQKWVESGPWGFRLYPRALLPSCPLLLLPLFSVVSFFKNSLVVGEYIGIYQSEWLKNKNINLWNMGQARGHNTCDSRSGGKPLVVFLERFSHTWMENSLRLHKEDRRAQGLQGFPGWDQSLQERRPRRRGSVLLWFLFRPACIAAFDKHSTISRVKRWAAFKGSWKQMQHKCFCSSIWVWGEAGLGSWKWKLG